MSIRLALGVVLPSLLLPLQPPPSSPPAPSTPARIERGACASDVATDERIECGVLVVPEYREKASGRTIRLPYMVFRSRSATPAPDPLVFVTGGPGNSNVARRRSGRQIPFLDHRDFVVLEPRGARHATPALECPAINALKGDIAAGRVVGRDAEAALVGAATACRQALVATGADLDGYTTAALADDLEDLRRALGYPAWNVQGLSYGTRVALTMLRRHPEGVRSAVLDSVLPPEVNFDEVSAANLLRALHRVFDGCAIDRECGAAFPDVQSRFTELVARADRSPLPIVIDTSDGGRPIQVRGAQVVDAVYAALHDTEAIAHIPRIIDDAASGRYESLATLVKQNQGPSSSSWGLRYSIWCADEAPFEDPARVAAQVSPTLGLGGIDEGAATPALCRAWNVRPSPAVEDTPVTSAVPTLIFAGEFDPDTPPQWGRQLLANLSKASYVEMPGRSHGAGFNACGLAIVTAFLRDPSVVPPVDCATTARGVDFVGR